MAAKSDNTDSPLAPTQLLLSDAFDESADSDAPEMDYAAEAYSFHERTLHFLPGQQINQSTRVQVEAALLIEAGTNVTSEHTTDLVMKTEYLKLLNGFQPTDFGDKDIKEMSCKLYNAKRGINEEGGGERLWKKFNDVRAEIRAKYMTKLPADLWKLASGKQLRDAYNKFIKDNYKVEKVSTTVKQLFCTIYYIICLANKIYIFFPTFQSQESVLEGTDEEDINVPDDWWYTSPLTRYLLACMVHRKNKEICNNCTQQAAGQPQAAQRDKSNARLASARAAETAASNDMDPDYQMHKQIRLSHGKMAIIKTQTDVVSLQLDLFMKHKNSFIEEYGLDAYNKKLVSLLGKLPDPDVDAHVLPTLARTSPPGTNTNAAGTDATAEEGGEPV